MKKQRFITVLLVLLACMNFLSNCASVRTNKDQTLTEEQIEAFRSAKTARISINQSYRGAKSKKSKNAKLLLDDFVGKLMNIFGLQVLSSDEKTHDLEIMIKITDFKPRSYTHESWNEIAFFTGLISFEMSNIPVYSEAFRADVYEYSTAFELIKDYRDLFSQHLLSYQLMVGLEFRLPYILKDVFGVSGVIESLKDENKDVRVAAASMLAWIRAPQAIELLIAVLKDENENFRLRIDKILCRIAGGIEGFEGNQKKWQDWWEKKKEKFIKKRL